MKKLEIRLKSLVAREREILGEILECILAIDRGRFYLEWGFGSLFAYLTEEIRYSPAAAQRRIDAVRLAMELPEVLEQVRSGALSLAQIGEAQKGFRRVEVDLEGKRALLAKLAAAPASEAARIVTEELQLEVVARSTSRPQADGSMRLSFNLSQEGQKNLKEVKEKLSHSIPNGDPGEIFEKLLAFYLEKQPKSTSAKNQAKTTSTAEAAAQQKTVPRPLHRFIHARDQRCQFKSSDGKLCGSTYQLQVDHRQMRFYGGGHEPVNLRLLCGRHNRYIAEKTMRGEPVD